MKKPISILKAIKSKPSIALQHMVDGLLKQSRRKNFRISMGTFGSGDGKICFGCAATCAIQNIAKINLTPATIDYAWHRAERTNMDFNELDEFEGVINEARSGHLKPLFRFCDIMDSPIAFEDNFNLWDDDWKQQLPQVRETIAKLKKAGY